MDVQNSPKMMISIGASIFIVLLCACLIIEASHIEKDLKSQLEQFATQSNIDWLTVEADGQNLVLSGNAPVFGDRNNVVEFAENIWGVAQVTNNIQLLGQSNTCQQEFDRYLSVGSIKFNSGGSNLSAESLQLVDRLADIARNCNATIRISGHTDSVGNGAENLRLSSARARKVRKQMMARGVLEDQVTAVGYGETRPIANNATRDGREKNRRIEFRVTGRT
ncbi:MAG: OmpA family protein [Pseudomonadales bacterium]|nr:OmpA family protein [Pseudomonadales bacterium]